MVHESITVNGISYADVPLVWDEVAHLIEPALLPAERTLQHVFDDCCTKDAQLWIGRRGGKAIAVMVTRICVYPAGKIAYIEHMGGESGDVFANYIPRVKQWAKAAGATRLRMGGRKGWLRLLKQHFDETYYIMESKL